LKKVCTKCNEAKPISDFYRAKRSKDGFHSWCKQCARKNDKKKKYYSKPGAKRKRNEWKYQNRYGITIGQRERMYANQDGKCGMCKQLVPYSEIYTDHDHKTGKVRALLCCRCNALLGYYETVETEELRKQFEKYLTIHNDM